MLSLVAVFLALGLGVLAGVSVSDSGAVESGEAGLVEDIKGDIEELRIEKNVLERDMATNRRFQDDSFPFIVGGRLQGRRIALVYSSKANDELRREVASAINGAGGQVVTTTVLNAGFDAAAAAAKLKKDIPGEPWSSVDQASAAGLVGKQLAREIGKAGGSRILTALQGVGVDSATGSYATGPDAVVLVTRADDEQTPAFAELEKQFLLGVREAGVMPVGCEPADAPRSEVPMFLSVDVSSVDNLNTRIGLISLVFVLGGEKGAFGVKPTADMLIPILRAPKVPAPGAQT